MTESSAGFGTSKLFLADSRLVLAVLDHLRYQGLNRVFGVSREPGERRHRDRAAERRRRRV